MSFLQQYMNEFKLTHKFQQYLTTFETNCAVARLLPAFTSYIYILKVYVYYINNNKYIKIVQKVFTIEMVFCA